jgi:hypothetical protein
MTKNPNPRKKAEYEVGYGKPPTHTQFKPGQCGNPKGRPKGARNFKTDVRETLAAPVRVTRDGKQKNVSTQEAMLLRLREQALSGNPRALDRLMSLAQAFNNEDFAAGSDLTADDADLLEIFKLRILSGVVAELDPSDGAKPKNNAAPEVKKKTNNSSNDDEV